MGKIKEFDIDIQYVRSVIGKCTKMCSYAVCKLLNTDKIINSRKNFIVFQFRNLFDGGYWY